MIEEFSHVCPDYALYTCSDMMAMEDETIQLIQGFVRATKPRIVVELGSYHGLTAKAIGQALQENGIGTCYSYELDKTSAAIASDICANLPVEVIDDDYNGYIDHYKSIDILLIDGDNSIGARYRDLELWTPAVRDLGLIFIHDALKGPGEYADTKQASTDCRLVLWTPRGLSIIQKRNFLCD